jgi:predicted amidohydrolase
MMSNSFIATAVQHPPVFLDLPKSIEKACDLITQAGREGASLIVFPETWLTGYPLWFDLAPGAALWDSDEANQVYQRLFENSPSLGHPAIQQLGKAAQSAGAILVMGLHERAGSTLYNTTLYIGTDSQIMGYHRKLVPTYSERLIWGRGDGSTLEVFDTPLGRLGGLICWEHWMPLARYTYHAQGEQIHIAQWPTVKSMHQIASRHYAFEGRCFVIAAGTVLHRDELSSSGLALFDQISDQEDGLLMRGGSCIFGPDGELLAEPLFNQPGLISAEIDLDKAVTKGMTLDVVGHYSRPDIFTLQVNKNPQKNVEWN